MLTSVQSEILNGLMLGDGSLNSTTNNSNSRLSIDRKLDDKLYNLYLSNIYNEYITDKSLSERHRFDKRTNKIYHTSSLNTKRSPNFTEFRHIWYKDNKKHIPNNFILTSTTLAIWLADDGHFCLRNGHIYLINFATNGFIKSEVEFLISLLENKYNFKFNLIQKPKNQYEINLYDQTNIMKLIKDIDPYFPQGMDRKSDLWRKNEKIWSYVMKEKLICPKCKENNTNFDGKREQKQRGFCKTCNKGFTLPCQ